MVARIAFRQGEFVYRFMTIEQHNDGSIYLAVDRDEDHGRGAMTLSSEGRWVETGELSDATQRRVSYHTTGRVNYHGPSGGPPRFFEPLHDVTARNAFLAVSIPRASRLSRATQPASTGSENVAVQIEVPAGFHERFAVALAIVPRSDVCDDLPVLARLDYEIFSLIVASDNLAHMVQPPSPDHFVYVATPGSFGAQAIGKLAAELAYHQVRHRTVGTLDGEASTAIGELLVIGPDGEGVYTLYPAVVMRVAPSLNIRFSRPDLTAEVVEGARPNRVRFRVRGKSGYIRDLDLRPLVSRIELHAEL